MTPPKRPNSKDPARRSSSRALQLAVALTLVLGSTGCSRSSCLSSETGEPRSLAGPESFTERERQTITSLSPLPPVPKDRTNHVSGDDDAAHFGRYLFFDKRLSANGEVRCATCHQPDHGFSVPTRLGEGLESTPRHPPSLLNVAHHEWFDWDGKADSLWAQAARPLENPGEHGMSRTDIVRTVAEIDDLRRGYEAVFDDLPSFESEERYPPGARPVPHDDSAPAHRKWRSMEKRDRRRVNRVFSNILKAIATYEERLVAGAAPFDRFVQGLESDDSAKLDAISPAARRGLKLFIGEAECINCHNGPNFTDEAFHNLGLGPRPWLRSNDPGRWSGVDEVRSSPFNAAGPYSDDRDGRGADWIRFLRQTPEDRGQFKTPTLRNVERTPPYMHGGHFETLEEVVRFYSTLDEEVTVGHREEMLEPLALSKRQIADLVAFLESLTGDPPPQKLMRPPETPVPPR